MRIDFLNALQKIAKELLGLGPIQARDNACRPHRIAFDGGLVCNLPSTVREPGIHLDHPVLEQLLDQCTRGGCLIRNSVGAN